MTQRWAWPLPAGKNRIRGSSLSNTFGGVRQNADGSTRNHQGWDFAAPIDTPCLAVADGTIVSIRDAGEYGLQILLQYAPDRFAFYAHLSETSVEIGETVVCGEEIARTGNSGNAESLPHSEDHLHFEIRTTPSPGKGLTGRLSPISLFGICPLHATI
jgi:murein DD-endopeptidase MepM/ murein hydrolase activator NlpD